MADLVVTNISDVLTASNIKVNWEKRSVYQEDPLLLAEVFPAKKVQGLQASYLKGFQEVTAALQPAVFDSKPVVGLFSLDLKHTDIDLFFFRESFVVGEKLRQDIDTFLAKGYQYAAALIQEAYDKNIKFVDKALVSTELMRAGCLTEGKFKLASSDDNGRRIIHQMNYDPTNAWHSNGVNYVVLSGNGRWLTANAAQDDFNPYAQLQARIDAIRIANGNVITRVYLNSATFDAMLKSEKIRKYINPVGYANALVTKNAIRTFMESELGVKFILIDRVYADLNTGATTKMFPDGYVCMVPETPVGYTCYGTTPEEHDLMNGKISGDVDVQVVNTGIAITTMVEVGPPVQTKTVVSEVVSPTFEAMDSICSMKVF